MTASRRNPLARAIDHYLESRALQGLVAFFAAGVSGGSVAVIFTSVITASLFWSATVGGLVGALFALWGWRSALKRTQHRQYTAETFFGPWIGAALLISMAGTILGITGVWNLLVAILLSLLVVFWLTVAPQPEPYPDR